ncbi:hypothetical protein Xcel_3049 [Xylanimonas cellulosilytica DSM 15894]|uniref:Uncharacterized protein n=1 Tax=Xylanimonas cellulosilytica (strain DSM 15894 / JCM 12276 / CECT 5975 / KCTC 9989 / LMG 20990 / NBRC 107835 / XIL07) TaxID=446471 RepID=D1BZS5_XYLCX|nr:hypothetical protein [Xylanimonas cellulosilytica]ACZ32053.1 hypothetical protein Xcel_3049 [Xylanimonas cellulosilytica DSM 15894]
MDRSTSPSVASQDIDRQPFTVTSKRLWSAIWVAFAAAMSVAAVDYVTLFMSALFPGWVWCVTTGGLLLAAGVVTVFMDVAFVRRERGSLRRDVVAKVVACVVFAVWALELWRALGTGCFGQECAAVPQAVTLFVVFPVVPLAALTLVGYLVRRGRVRTPHPTRRSGARRVDTA